MLKFGVVGCGKMGQALVSDLVDYLSCPIVCCDVSSEAREKMQTIVGDKGHVCDNMDEIVESCDVVLVAVKPVHAQEVFKELGGGCDKTILSIVAGMSSFQIESLSGCEHVIRMMPNTPVMVGAGSIVVLDSELSDEDKKLVQDLFLHTNSVYFVEHESTMDAVTGLSGSGPALFAMMVEAMADAAVAEGLPRGLANALARETMEGTAELLRKQHPAVLKENVMSPGGTTAAGVMAAEKAGFRAAAMAFVRAATEKSRNM